MVVLTNFQPKRSNAVAPTEPSLVTRAVKSNLPFRFYNIGNGRNQVTLLENREELYKEASRLHQIGWFLATFHERAQEAHIDIDEGMLILMALFMFHSFVIEISLLHGANWL
jgi:hypothetical protein